MLAENCKYRSKEVPACNTSKELRGCDSIICCSICPRVNYCTHVCGAVLNEQQTNITQIIEDLKIIEIELFSFCNRKCSWCPNGKLIDRHSFNQYLDKKLLKNFLIELNEFNYYGVFSFSRYNEPFYDFNYFQECLSLIKEYFPYNKLVTNTNGDFLTKEKIFLTKIDELTIMDYDCKGKEWVLSRLKEWDVSDIIEYENYFVGVVNNTTILYYWDWPKVGVISDRGGNLKEYSLEIRDYPCFEPFRFLGINYDGTISPCCNIRNDSLNQKDYIFGNLNTQNLKQILTSNSFKDFKSKVSIGEFDKIMPCYFCNNNGGRYSKFNDILYK